MSVLNNVRELLPEDSLVFDNPAYDNSIIGYSNGGSVIYDYDLMVEELMKDDGISEEDAVDFIDYNTLGASPPLSYSGNPAPIVMFRLIR